MTGRIIIIKHEAVPNCGSFEVRFPDDGRPSKYFYFEDLPGRRLRAEQLTREELWSKPERLRGWSRTSSTPTITKVRRALCGCR
jgi:hypothetical protein